MSSGSETTDANGTVGIEAEDFEKGENDRRSSCDNRSANDGHLPLINITTSDGEAPVDDARNAEDEAEHHDYGETVADARLEVCGTERRGLRERRERVEGEHRRCHENGRQPRANFGIDLFDYFHAR